MCIIYTQSSDDMLRCNRTRTKTHARYIKNVCKSRTAKF